MAFGRCRKCRWWNAGRRARPIAEGRRKPPYPWRAPHAVCVRVLDDRVCRRSISLISYSSLPGLTRQSMRRRGCFRLRSAFVAANQHRPPGQARWARTRHCCSHTRARRRRGNGCLSFAVDADVTQRPWRATGWGASPHSYGADHARRRRRCRKSARRGAAPSPHSPCAQRADRLGSRRCYPRWQEGKKLPLRGVAGGAGGRQRAEIGAEIGQRGQRLRRRR